MFVPSDVLEIFDPAKSGFQPAPYHLAAARQWTLTTAMVLETSKGNFEIAVALAVLLLLLVFSVNWALTSIQQRRR